MIAAATHATIDQYASQLAARPVHVACVRNQRFPAVVQAFTVSTKLDDGTIVYRPVIYLPARTCDELARLIITRAPRAHPPTVYDIVDVGGPILDAAGGKAAHDLIHETTHIRLASRDEALVECTAYRNAWQVVRLFRLAAWKAREVLRGITFAHVNTIPAYQQDC